MQERWVEIEDFPNYLISNYGEIVSRVNDRRLTYRPTTRGYLRVALSHEGRVKDFYVHQLVAKTFIKDFAPGTKVRHFDDDKTNNAVFNLRVLRGRRVEQITRRSNERDSWGRRVRIIETGEVFRTARECARYLGGDYSSIYAVLRGDRRSHLGYKFEYVKEWQSK